MRCEPTWGSGASSPPPLRLCTALVSPRSDLDSFRNSRGQTATPVDFRPLIPER